MWLDGEAQKIIVQYGGHWSEGRKPRWVYKEKAFCSTLLAQEFFQKAALPKGVWGEELKSGFKFYVSSLHLHEIFPEWPKPKPRKMPWETEPSEQAEQPELF